MSRLREVAGLLLVGFSLTVTLQTIREVAQSYLAPWHETYVSTDSVTFAGRRIAIVRSDVKPDSPRTSLARAERVWVDGVMMSRDTSQCLGAWPIAGMRSPFWIEVTRFAHRSGRDSSLMIAPPSAALGHVTRDDRIGRGRQVGQDLRAHAGAPRRKGGRATLARDRPHHRRCPLRVPAIRQLARPLPSVGAVFPIGTGILGGLLMRRQRACENPR
jgi:hypothetical protein